MATKTSPIGIIDSGIGGFSVALKMQQQLPHENLLYFGDGGNMPYGNHSAEEILTMTRYMLRFMEERGVKALLVACNTISCLIDRYRDDMTCPVLSVVEAGADAVSQMAVHKVGVISTCFTHSTRCYPDLIGKKAPDKEVVSHGCPDLAKLVEANVGDPAGQGILDADIQANMDALVNQEKIDCCVLGCTHYPLLTDVIAEVCGPGVELVSAGEESAFELKRLLKADGLRADENRQGETAFYVSDRADDFEHTASLFLQEDLRHSARRIDIEQY